MSEHHDDDVPVPEPGEPGDAGWVGQDAGAADDRSRPAAASGDEQDTSEDPAGRGRGTPRREEGGL